MSRKLLKKQSLYITQRMKDFLGGDDNVSERVLYIAEAYRIILREAQKKIQRDFTQDEIHICCAACWSTAFPHETGSSPSMCIGLVAADVAAAEIEELALAVDGFTQEDRRALVKKLSHLSTAEEMALCELIAEERERLSKIEKPAKKKK